MRAVCSQSARFALVTVSLIAALTGCGKGNTKHTAAPPKPAAPPVVSDVDLKTYRPNEAGAVMVLMYHRIEADKPSGNMNRTPAEFRQDLQALYDHGYRPVTLSEFGEGRIDLPAGRSPVVITFDDSYKSQFAYVGGPDGEQVDPECAVGIMEAFHQQHADWPTKATFFVLQGAKNPPAFYQSDSLEDKFAHLQQAGFEIGSHTLHHSNLRSATAAQVSAEIAGSIRALHEVLPDLKVTSLAIPYGKIPRSDDAIKAIAEGEEGGTQYRITSAVKAAWRPTLSPYTKPQKRAPFAGQVAGFDPLLIERVLPDSTQATSPGTFEYYLKFLDENPRMRYISDGNPNVVSVPKGMRSFADEAKIKALGKTLQVYSLTASRNVAPGTTPAR